MLRSNAASPPISTAQQAQEAAARKGPSAAPSMKCAEGTGLGNVRSWLHREGLSCTLPVPRCWLSQMAKGLPKRRLCALYTDLGYFPTQPTPMFCTLPFPYLASYTWPKWPCLKLALRSLCCLPLPSCSLGLKCACGPSGSCRQ